jgi:hypothetical protein
MPGRIELGSHQNINPGKGFYLNVRDLTNSSAACAATTKLVPR